MVLRYVSGFDFAVECYPLEPLVGGIMANLNERQRARKLAAQHNLGELENDIKWCEFFSEVIAKKIPVEIKPLGEPEVFPCKMVWSPSLNYIEGSGISPYLFVFLEHVTSSKSNELTGIAS